MRARLAQQHQRKLFASSSSCFTHYGAQKYNNYNTLIHNGVIHSATTIKLKSKATEERRCERRAYYSTQAATPAESEAKPFEEMPAASMQEIMEMGGFMRGLHLYPNLYKRYGPLVRLGVPGSNMVWVFHPDDIKYVMQHEGKWPIGAASAVWPIVKVTKKANLKLIGFSQGEEWRRLRTELQKNFFAPADADNYMPLITPVVKDALKVIKNYENNMDRFLSMVTLEMIASVLFGQSLGILNGSASPQDEEYLKQVNVLFTDAERLMYSRNPMEVTDSELKPIEDSFSYLYKRGEQRIKAALEKHAAGQLKCPATPYVLKTVDLKDITKEEVGQNVVGMLSAGVETTSNSIQWFLYHLARNQEVQAKLHEELKGVLKGRMLTKEDLTELPYLKACLKETFRLTPTTPGTGRELPEPITLRGYQIPSGTRMFLVPFPTCMSDSVFDNPTQFNPERYDKKAKEERKESNPYHDSPYVHMPFSRGPRMCMGARLAELEVYSFIAGLIQEYKIELAPGSPLPEPITRLTIRPEPSPSYIISSHN